MNEPMPYLVYAVKQYDFMDEATARRVSGVTIEYVDLGLPLEAAGHAGYAQGHASAPSTMAAVFAAGEGYYDLTFGVALRRGRDGQETARIRVRTARYLGPFSVPTLAMLEDGMVARKPS